MRTLNYVVLVLVSFGFVSFGCGDSDSPTAPSVMQDAPSVRATAPSTPVQAMPASFNPDALRHDIRDGFNAYEFNVSYDGSMLTLTLTEDEMSGMREASKPHRNRTITVEICSSEPKLITRSCGDQIWRGSVVLSGTVNLDPIPLASCDGWITVNAAELSDDRNEGWRNAPCPMPDGDPVGSDGTGATWPDYDGYDPDDPRASKPEPQPEPEPTPTPEPEPTMPEPGPTTPQGPRHPFPPQGPEPELVADSLPVDLSDPTGDLDWTAWPDYDGGSRLSTDVTSLSLSEQDADGWIRVTFTLASAFDLTAIATAATADVAATATEVNASARVYFYPPAAATWHRFSIGYYERYTCSGDCQPLGVWNPFYENGRDSQALSYVRVPDSVTGTTFSFEINPPAALRGAPARRPRFEFTVWIAGVDPGDPLTRTYDVQSEDSVNLPAPFTLPNLP